MAIGLQPGGIEIRNSDGRLQQVVLKNFDINTMGFLSDGRYVVQITDSILNLYSVAGEKVDVTFKTLSYEEGGCGDLTVDSVMIKFI